MATVEKKTSKDIERLYDLLKQKGYELEKPDGNWLWVSDRFSYLITYHEDDPSFYQLTLPIGGDDDASQMRIKNLSAANSATARTKFVKAYLDDDNGLNFVIDALVSGPEEYADKFPRFLSAIQVALQIFNEKTGG